MFIKRLIDYVSLNLSGNRSSILYLIISTRVLLMCPQLAHFLFLLFCMVVWRLGGPKCHCWIETLCCREVVRTLKRGIPVVLPSSPSSVNMMIANPHQVLPCYLHVVKTGNWAESRLNTGRVTGNTEVPRNSITKLHCHWLLNSWPTRGSETHKSLLWIAQ